MFFFLVLFFRDPMIRSDDPVWWSDPGFVDADRALSAEQVGVEAREQCFPLRPHFHIQTLVWLIII